MNAIYHPFSISAAFFVAVQRFLVVCCLVIAYSPAVMAQAEQELVRIGAESPISWQPINDGVMGGVSSSSAQLTAAGTLVFSGTVSLENNGGFASIRSSGAAGPSPAARGITLTVHGDGKRYKLNLRTSGAFDSVQYQAAFDTRADKWETIRIPFGEFRPVFRGRAVTDAPPLDPQHIVSVGFLISNRQTGPFRLEIRAIDTYEI
jgi:monofunctional biosynthetic peptidoglycan transglycosylase